MCWLGPICWVSGVEVVFKASWVCTFVGFHLERFRCKDCWARNVCILVSISIFVYREYSWMKYLHTSSWTSNGFHLSVTSTVDVRGLAEQFTLSALLNWLWEWSRIHWTLATLVAPCTQFPSINLLSWRLEWWLMVVPFVVEPRLATTTPEQDQRHTSCVVRCLGPCLADKTNPETHQGSEDGCAAQWLACQY